MSDAWDYLIVTASNERQAASYRRQLALRRQLGLLLGIRQECVVADPEGRRIGSGGSTLGCLLEVLQQEMGERPEELACARAWRRVLGSLRILILHAGGDSRRLPAYGPCGKIFLPLPLRGDGALGVTLFDRLLPGYRDFPAMPEGAGQVVLAAGDILVEFHPDEIRLAPQGLTGLGAWATAEQASHHGVYCLEADGSVRRFLQKPSIDMQREAGALDGEGLSILDVGVLNFDAATAVRLLELCDPAADHDGHLTWQGPRGEAIEAYGLDFYREICCALGAETTRADYERSVCSSGSRWDSARLGQVFTQLRAIPFSAQVLDRGSFLHFGTTREIIASGQELLRREARMQPNGSCLSVNNQIRGEAQLAACDAWVEACSIAKPMTLAGGNVVVGVDVAQQLRLPPQACLDVLPGRNRSGTPVHFIRCYREDDPFHQATASEVTLCGYPLANWLKAALGTPEAIWAAELSAERRSAWNARLFPAEDEASGYRRWLWMFAPQEASAEQFVAWRQADRYSLEEMTLLADQEGFHHRRVTVRGTEVRRSLRRHFCGQSGFSAADLAHLLEHAPEREVWLSELIAEARWHFEHADRRPPEEQFTCSRILHSLGSALLASTHEAQRPLGQLLPQIDHTWAPADAEWLEEMELQPDLHQPLGEWAARLQSAAFVQLRRQILDSAAPSPEPPRSTLLRDEIVWGRAPVRIDFAGSWTDTPPYALEHGGWVLNAAVDLNTQPPIQVYARLTSEPVLRFRSIDVGSQLEIRDWDALLELTATGEFSLVKAALVQSGFTAAVFGGGYSLAQALRQFGGGLELTTMAAIPKGSGLGTSSIMGAVLLAVIQRVLGRRLSTADVFQGVLRLEQALTTGGGWQDQIGGLVGGLKLVSTLPGLLPEPTIRYVPDEILTPGSGAGAVLLYYTGITRLAKNVLQEIVGHYLDRDRATMATLREIGQLAQETADAVARRDYPRFGRLVGRSHALNKELDPHSTSDELEQLFERIQPHLYGGKLLGAGGGGFAVLVCKTAEAAEQARAELRQRAPNAEARFFDAAVSRQGLEVNVC